LPRLVAADGLFLFAVKKTSRASLNTVENIKAGEKTKTSAENFSFEASAWAWAVEPDPDSYRDVKPISVERGYGAMA
jgi:hypothetical protein